MPGGGAVKQAEGVRGDTGGEVVKWCRMPGGGAVKDVRGDTGGEVV